VNDVNSHSNRQIYRLPAAALCTWFCLCAAGCGSLSQPSLARAYFAIEPGSPKPAIPTSQPGRAPILTVEPLRVSQPFDGLNFVYKIGPSQFDFDPYDTYVAPPSDLLTGTLIHWLNQSSPLITVRSASTLRSDLVLEGEITALYIDSTAAPSRTAVVAGRFFLIRQHAGEYDLLGDMPFAESAPVSAQTPAAFAKALGRAWRQVLLGVTEQLENKALPVATDKAAR